LPSDFVFILCGCKKFVFATLGCNIKAVAIGTNQLSHMNNSSRVIFTTEVCSAILSSLSL